MKVPSTETVDWETAEDTGEAYHKEVVPFEGSTVGFLVPDNCHGSVTITAMAYPLILVVESQDGSSSMTIRIEEPE